MRVDAQAQALNTAGSGIASHAVEAVLAWSILRREIVMAQTTAELALPGRRRGAALSRIES